MPTYKTPCIYCGTLIDGDSDFCPKCGASSPFGYKCPTCLQKIEKGDLRCSDCGRPLYITCPKCGEQTFLAEFCEKCGHDLMVICANPRCGQRQFYQNVKCTACGKKLKAAKQKKVK